MTQKSSWLLVVVFFAYFVAIQYVSVLIKGSVWNYLQYVWANQGVGILKENCITGRSMTDCALVKEWLNVTNVKIKIVHALSLFSLAITSAALGSIVGVFLWRKA